LAGRSNGWHADNRAFGPTVMSLSLQSAARLQLRAAADGDTGTPAAPFEVELAPRSLFVLASDARATWQHRVCPVRNERYSITVRSLASRATE
jgi:alkylated DNA repair dioxygenase AlkB